MGIKTLVNEFPGWLVTARSVTLSCSIDKRVLVSDFFLELEYWLELSTVFIGSHSDRAENTGDRRLALLISSYMKGFEMSILR